MFATDVAVQCGHHQRLSTSVRIGGCKISCLCLNNGQRLFDFQRQAEKREKLPQQKRDQLLRAPADLRNKSITLQLVKTLHTEKIYSLCEMMNATIFSSVNKFGEQHTMLCFPELMLICEEALEHAMIHLRYYMILEVEVSSAVTRCVP